MKQDEVRPHWIFFAFFFTIYFLITIAMLEGLTTYNDPAGESVQDITPNKEKKSKPGMNERIRMLREESVTTPATLSIERALIETSFYKQNEGKYSTPVMRAMNFMEICNRKEIYIGDHELIVGERGERPKAVYTFPELTIHSVDDLRVLNTR